MIETTELRFKTSEIRVAPGRSGQPTAIRGYAAVFNSISEDLGGFTEKISPGAFRSAIAVGKEILALMHHDVKQIIGRRSAGTLSVAEDTRGLSFEIYPGDTTAGRDAVEMVRRGDIRGASFRFSNAVSTWDYATTGKVRTISSIGELMEITLTGIPAYLATTASLMEFSEPRSTPRRDYARRRLQLAAMEL